MGRYTNRPFQKGKTLCGGDATQIAAADYSKCGTEYDFQHESTGRRGVLRAVKNASGITLYGKQPVTLNTAGTQITGYSTRASDRSVLLDDDLDATGVANGDVCYVIVRGVGQVKTAGASLVSIVDGDELVAATAAASTAAGTTAAGVNKVANVTAGTDGQTIPRGVFARAISAATTNNTATAILALVNAPFV